MAELNAKQTDRNLLKKGFNENGGDHHYYEFWHDGKFIAKTRTSRGTGTIHKALIGAMSKQCKVSQSFFKDFASCTKSKEDYIAELKKNGIISNS